jgi:hypothetical protein
MFLVYDDSVVPFQFLPLSQGEEEMRANFDINDIANSIIEKALVDQTEPGSENLRSGWATDMLFREADSEIIIRGNDPFSYAQIGELVLAQVGHLPEMAALASLAIFRGKRLLPLNEDNTRELIDMASRLDHEISALPEGTRNMRCRSLLQYHKAIFFDACGRFDLAAGLQRKSAEEAVRLGDGAGASIARFCEVFSLLMDALMRGHEQEYGDLFSRLEMGFTALGQAVKGSPLEVQWAEGNCPLHMIEAVVWLENFPEQWSAWVKIAIDASKKLGEAFTPGADFIKAVDADRNQKPGADNLLRQVVDGKDVPRRRATALLVLARQAIKAGRTEQALRFVDIMPVEGAQHVRAIAERMLKQNIWRIMNVVLCGSSLPGLENLGPEIKAVVARLACDSAYQNITVRQLLNIGRDLSDPRNYYLGGCGHVMPTHDRLEEDAKQFADALLSQR